MVFHWRKYYFAIIGLAISLIISQYVFSDGYEKPFDVPIVEDAYFDPFCTNVENQRLTQFAKYDTTKFCNEHDNGIIQLGSSENIQMGSDTYTRYMYMKMNIDKIPKSDWFYDVNILDAQLELNTGYRINQTNPNGDFIIFNGLCDDNSWSETSGHEEFPCLTQYYRPQLIKTSFSEPIYAKYIKSISLDLTSQLKYAISNNLTVITEVIEFTPMQHIIEDYFTFEQQQCIFNADSVYLARDCIEQNRISIYTSENNSDGLKPMMVIQISKSLTTQAQAINTVVLTLVPLLVSIIIYWDRQKESSRKKMIAVCNTLEQEIQDIHNGLTSDEFERKTELKMTYKSGLPYFISHHSKPISLVVLSVDAYNEVIHSGSFENFEPEHQTKISTLYNHVKVYNKEYSDFMKFMDQFHILAGDVEEFKKRGDHYGSLITYYGNYLGDIREKILNFIDETLLIMENEKISNS